MRSIFYILLVGLISTSLAAQTGSITGKITDGVEPMMFANVAIVGTSLGATTDETGNFQITNLPVGSYELAASIVGYRSINKTISITDNQQIDLGTLTIQEDVFGLEEVVVTGTMKESFVTDSPVKIEVITARFLEKNTTPTNIVEGITLVNGVQEVVACGVCYTNSISINGLPGAYTAVLMDGTPIYGNLASVYGLNGIPTTIIDRFEVIKGPNSTLYGSEAVAGVINIITKDPSSQPLLTVDIMGTTHLESFGNISVAPRIGKFDGFIGLNYAYLDNFDDDNGDGFGDNISMDRISLFSKWSMRRPSGKKFTLSGKYYYEDRRNGVEAFIKDRAYKELRGDDTIYGESILTNRVELFGTYELATSENIKVDYSFSHHLQDSYYGADFYKAEQTIGFANLIWNKEIKNHDLTLGLTSRYQYYDDNTVATQIEDGLNRADKQFTPGIFAQDEWRLSNKLSILSGARLDHYNAHGLIFSPRLSAKYNPESWTTIRLNGGTGFRIVNLFTEDHAFVTGQREVVLLESLKPERSYNGAFNFNHIFITNNSSGSIDFDGYYTYFTNKIIPNYDTFGKIIYGNTNGHAVSKGLSININQQFDGGLSYSLGYNVQRATETEIDEQGNAATRGIEFSSDWGGVAILNYEWRKQQLLFAYTARFTGETTLPEVFDLDTNGQPLATSRPTQSAPFSIHNIQITKTLKKKNLSIYIGMQNIYDYRQPYSPLIGFNDPNAAPGFSDAFDTAYAYSPLNGRELYLGVKWNTGKRK